MGLGKDGCEVKEWVRVRLGFGCSNLKLGDTSRTAQYATQKHYRIPRKEKMLNYNTAPPINFVFKAS